MGKTAIPILAQDTGFVITRNDYGRYQLVKLSHVNSMILFPEKGIPGQLFKTVKLWDGTLQGEKALQ